MIANLKPYPAMKDSNVPWLREVPEHWEVKRLRNAAEMRVSNVDKHTKEDERPVRLCNYVDVYKNARIRAQMPFMSATASPDEIERFRLRRGDVLITKDSEAWNDIGVPALVEEPADDLICGYHLALLRPFTDHLLSNYFFWALRSTAVAYQFHIEANGITRYGLTHAAIKSIWLPLPHLREQTAIVRLLDHADRRIRRYIRAKQKLIKLLEEQKQAIIHRAVTRGLDPNVRLKPSGMEWLGDVPENWEVARVKQCAYKISKGTTPSTEGCEILEVGPVRFIKAENVSGGRIIDRPVCFIDEQTNAVLRRSQLREHDILFVIAGATLGKIAVVDSAQLPANTNQAVAFIRPNRRVNHDFLSLWLQSSRIRELIWLNAVQSAQPNLSMADLGNFVVPIPPLAEQRQILGAVHIKIVPVENGIDRAQHEISLLREYRTRLIADVVTGKLDVREAAAKLPEESEDLEQVDEGEAMSEAEGDTAEELDAVPEEEEA